MNTAESNKFEAYIQDWLNNLDPVTRDHVKAIVAFGIHEYNKLYPDETIYMSATTSQHLDDFLKEYKVMEMPNG